MPDQVAVRVLQLHTSPALRAELERVGADPSGTFRALDEQLARAHCLVVKLEGVSLALARFLYQELVMEGGQVVTAPRLDHVGPDGTDALLCATRYQLQHLLVRLRWQPSEELQLLAGDMERALDRFEQLPPALALGAVRLDWAEHTHVMGILNVTPDSFSGDALIQPGDAPEAWTRRAAARANQLVADGAAILDVGGESTRPGADAVPLHIELERVLPVLRALQEQVAVPLSVDTRKAQVAAAALSAGAVLVNDVTGLRGDPNMARVIAEHRAAVVLMHNGRPDPRARDFLGAMCDDLRAQLDLALSAGIDPSRILFDPGIGFGKTARQNLEILDRLGEFRVLGGPILIGPSRKGFISKVLAVPAAERDEGTAATIAVGILRGANMVRVHNVRVMARIARMTDALRGVGAPVDA
jgi:dihydropteroate synthase